MSFKQFSFAVLALFIGAGLTCGGSIDLHASHSTPAGAPAGYTVNQLTVDFTDTAATPSVGGQQMLVTLTTGNVFIHSGGLHAEAGADPALYPFYPQLQFDTYVTFGPVPPGGGGVDAGNNNVLIGGGAANLGGGATKKFDSTGLDLFWAPGTGHVVPPQNGLLTAQVTLSNTANGTFSYYSTTADGTVRTWLNRSIVNGVISVVPEPASVTLAAMALFGLCGRIRYRSQAPEIGGNWPGAR